MSQIKLAVSKRRRVGVTNKHILLKMPEDLYSEMKRLTLGADSVTVEALVRYALKHLEKEPNQLNIEI